jgi:hypothetical protein
MAAGALAALVLAAVVGRVKDQREVRIEMTKCDCNEACAVRKWIGDVSAERVGQLWRTEGHEALLSAMRAADGLTKALVALARREALESISKTDERKEHHGTGSQTEPLGTDVHAGGN